MRNEESNWLEKLVSGTGGTLALAFICNKVPALRYDDVGPFDFPKCAPGTRSHLRDRLPQFLFPVRTPITIGLTPLVARHLEVGDSMRCWHQPSPRCSLAARMTGVSDIPLRPQRIRQAKAVKL